MERIETERYDEKFRAFRQAWGENRNNVDGDDRKSDGGEDKIMDLWVVADTSRPLFRRLFLSSVITRH